MLSWLFGELKENIVHVHQHDRAAGYLEFEKARVRWFLSIESNTIPGEVSAEGKRTFRSLSINGESFEFSDGFTELHTNSYSKILEGEGFGLMEAKTAIEIVDSIHTQTSIGFKSDFHILAALHLTRNGLL